MFYSRCLGAMDGLKPEDQRSHYCRGPSTPLQQLYHNPTFFSARGR